STVDDADDTVTTEAEMDDSAVTGHISEAEDVAYLTFSDGVPELAENERYQVWLFEEQGGSVVAVSTYPAEGMENDEVQFRGVNAFELLWVTVEPQTGSESPSGTALDEMPHHV